MRIAAPSPSYVRISKDDETSLMVGFQVHRSAEAFETLYRATAPGLLLWIEQLHAQGRLTGDPMDALQDTFVNIYRYAGSFRQSAAGGFRAWARTIASNAMRRAKRRPRALGVLFSELDGVTLPDPEDRAAGPARAAERRETTVDLRKAYALMLLQYAQAYQTLKARDQEAIAMVEVEGLNYAQVGERLGVGRSNTKMIVFRARQRLRARIARFSAAAAQGEACVRPQGSGRAVASGSLGPAIR